MKKEHAIIGFVAVAVVCFALGYMLGNKSGGGDVKEGAIAPPVAKADKAADDKAPSKAPSGPDSDIIPVGTSIVKGPANAAVTIIEFSEFQCPFCSRVLPTMDKLAKEYPNDVRIVFKHNPLSFHKDAPLAAEASLAAGEQGKFWEYHDILFKNQRALKREQLEQYAQQLQLDMDKFKKDLDSGKYKKQIADDQALAGKLGARGTPNFFVNGKRLSGAQPFDKFKAAVEDALKRAEPQIKKGLKGDALYEEIIAKGASEFKAAAAPKRAPDTTVYKVDSSRAPIKGSKNAPITIVEFSEFQCPFCTRVLPTLKKIEEKYGDKVKVAFMHLPLPFHKDADLAAQAAMAAHEQGKFWEYHDILFQNQKALKREQLEQYAQQLGLNMDKFKAALDSGKYKEHVEKDKAEARKHGASGTPTFFVNGRKLVGAQPFASFEKLIDEQLKKAGK